MDSKDRSSPELLKAISATPAGERGCQRKTEAQGKVLETDVGLRFLSLWAELQGLFSKVAGLGFPTPADISELSSGPRRLLKPHLYHPLWSAFFEEIGIWSPPSSCIQLCRRNGVAPQAHLLKS